MRSKYLFIFIILFSIKVNSQILDPILEPILEPSKNFRAADSLLKEPSFSVHRDNYFLTGIPVNTHVTSDNADVKYQVSFKLRLNSKPLWGGFFPYLMYTQKAFWDIYANSKPFSEINFNPGIALVRPFYLKGGRLTYGAISMEHESNGRDSIYSRTWNMLAFSLKSQISPRWVVGLRGWIPLVDKEDNPGLTKYVGYGEASATYQIQPGRWSADILFRKGSGLINYGSLQTQLNWRPYRNENYYLTLQWFVGYTESLIDYQEHKSMIRLGFTIKPENMGIF